MSVRSADKSLSPMLFNSIEFLYFFLPCVLGVYAFLLKTNSRQACLWWLVLASLFFYGWWDLAYLGVLVLSLLFNYAIGVGIMRHPKWGRALFILGVCTDLLLLAYFKYWNFFSGNINALISTQLPLKDIVLPLGISFFTFQQIAYRTEVWLGNRRNDDFLSYCACVTFFPHLIAGPIVYYDELMPQFHDSKNFRLRLDHIAIGLSLFAFGLFKKTMADWYLSPSANIIFDSVHLNGQVTFFEAWIGALSYTLQLYFDFSGYCDMACGLGYLFNIRLPLNFNSPYKSLSVREFWKRWHITLSRFFRSYVFKPLQQRFPKHHLSFLMLTMLLSGLWHGAGWTFIFWGGLHGIYLVINHRWGDSGAAEKVRQTIGPLYPWASWALTFVCVTFAWVLFRAADLHTATTMYQSMLGWNGIALSRSIQNSLSFLPKGFFHFGGILSPGVALDLKGLPILLLVALAFPNVYEIVAHYKPVMEEKDPRTQLKAWKIWQWDPNAFLGSLTGFLLFYYLLSSFTGAPRQFLYFNF